MVSVKKVKKRSEALSPQSAIAAGIGVVAGEKIARSVFPFNASMHLVPAPAGFGSHTFLGRSPGDIRMLSVSTTTYLFRISEAKRLGGILNWNATIIETLMFGQEQGAVAVSGCFLGDRFHRITYLAEPGLYALDNATLVEEMIWIGRKVAEKKEHLDKVVRPHFLNGTPAAPFTPAPPDRAHLEGTRPGEGTAR
jgi:hypothetical protein